MAKSLLIVDDELDIQSSLAFALKDEGYEVFTATLPAEAEEILKVESIDVGLFDVWFPEGDGIELLKYTREKNPQTSIVMMSGHGNIELALKAIRLGAFDFLEKPLELEKVLVVLRNAAELQSLRVENKRLSKQLVQSHELLGSSPAITSLRDAISKAASATSHVLVLGENGSGKELVAQMLHDNSSRAAKAFVAVNCAAIPENLFESELFGHERGSFTGANSRSIGRFEQAGSGTLFLDEISELSLSAQGKLLRVLEDRKFERVGGRSSLKTEARVVAASNRDLQQMIREGRFREDLYFRLKVLAITVPPLRDHPQDLSTLAEHFLKFFASENSRVTPAISAEFKAWMERYEWPGNVRELRNLMERLLIMNPAKAELGLGDLPEELQTPVHLRSTSLSKIQDPKGALRELRAEFERTIIDQRLKALEGNVTKAAESLGIERAHLHRKLRQYGIAH